MPKDEKLFLPWRWVYHFMAGRFEGLSDLDWKLFEDIVSSSSLLKAAISFPATK